MGYEDLKQAVLRKIDLERDIVKTMIEKAKKCEDWEEIRDEITFIIQAYGSIMMIDRLIEVEKQHDEDSADTEEKFEESEETTEEES